MGLDSVHLMMEIERAFEVTFSNQEAEKINTLSDCTNCIAKLKKVNNSTDPKIQELRAMILSSCIKIGELEAFSPFQKIAHVINREQLHLIDAISHVTGLNIPKPKFGYINKDSFIKKLLISKPNYNWEELTMNDFIDSILISNYKSFVNFKAPNSLDEIYFGIAGITSENMDISSYEIEPSKSFCNDLGID